MTHFLLLLHLRMSIWKCPTCMTTTATSPTAPSAAAAERFCCAATPTAAGGKPLPHLTPPPPTHLPPFPLSLPPAHLLIFFLLLLPALTSCSHFPSPGVSAWTAWTSWWIPGRQTAPATWIRGAATCASRRSSTVSCGGATTGASSCKSSSLTTMGRSL